MTAKFSLRAIVRQVRDELATGDRYRIAKEALPRIPAEYRDAAFLEALAEVARSVVNSGHPQIRGVPPQPDALMPRPTASKAGNRNSARSHKVAAIRRAWPELRAIYVSIDKDKLLADYSSENLNALADWLEKQARHSSIKARKYRKLAVLMDQAAAEKVSDLPDDVLAAVFEGEAA